MLIEIAGKEFSVDIVKKAWYQTVKAIAQHFADAGLRKLCGLSQ